MKIQCVVVFLYVYSVICDNETDIKNDIRMGGNIIDRPSTRSSSYRTFIKSSDSYMYRYRNYGSVATMFYPIAEDVDYAKFWFAAKESKFVCRAQDVIVHLKYGSYPALNPDKYAFPKYFVNPSRRLSHTYDFYMTSNGNYRAHEIKHPVPGVYYAIAYVKWEYTSVQPGGARGEYCKSIDRRLESSTLGFEQSMHLKYVKVVKRMGSDCYTSFETEVQVTRFYKYEYATCYGHLYIVDYRTLPLTLKCESYDSIRPIHFYFRLKHIVKDWYRWYRHYEAKRIAVKIKAQSRPTGNVDDVKCIFDPNTNAIQKISFYTFPTTPHFIHISYSSADERDHLTDCSLFKDVDYHGLTQHTITDLSRDSSDQFFTFSYGTGLDDFKKNYSTTISLPMANVVVSHRFRIYPFVDVGGNLILEATLATGTNEGEDSYRDMRTLLSFLKRRPPGYPDYPGYQQGPPRPMVKKKTLMKVVVCIDIAHPGIPIASEECVFNARRKKAFFVMDAADPVLHQKIIIPYPESGMWYISMRLFCTEINITYYGRCEPSDFNLKYYSDYKTRRGDCEISQSTKMRSQGCSNSVTLKLNSFSCLEGGCVNEGVCRVHNTSGLSISYCACPPGYGAWDCSDDSRLVKRGDDMLKPLLMLVLSNLLFFFTIYISIIRHYYPEALVYFVTMVFSIFFHSCDAPKEVRFCILELDFLEFGDFYCFLLTFWVTFVAMSIMIDPYKQLLRISGVVILALLATTMISFGLFSSTLLFGLAVLLVSWGIDYKRASYWMYPRDYYTTYFPIGLFSILTGLVIFVYYQSDANFHITHMLWHMIVALSIVFLLPDSKRQGVSPFLPGPGK